VAVLKINIIVARLGKFILVGASAPKLVKPIGS